MGETVLCGHGLGACKDTICYIPGCGLLLSTVASTFSMVRPGSGCDYIFGCVHVWVWVRFGVCQHLDVVISNGLGLL